VGETVSGAGAAGAAGAATCLVFVTVQVGTLDCVLESVMFEQPL
jgi:hypothetical protein